MQVRRGLLPEFGVESERRIVSERERGREEGPARGKEDARRIRDLRETPRSFRRRQSSETSFSRTASSGGLFLARAGESPATTTTMRVLSLPFRNKTPDTYLLSFAMVRGRLVGAAATRDASTERPSRDTSSNVAPAPDDRNRSKEILTEW